jgi:hypothetical protein
LRGVAGRVPAFVMVGVAVCDVAMGGSLGCWWVVRRMRG